MLLKDMFVNIVKRNFEFFDFVQMTDGKFSILYECVCRLGLADCMVWWSGEERGM